MRVSLPGPVARYATAHATFVNELNNVLLYTAGTLVYVLRSIGWQVYLKVFSKLSSSISISNSDENWNTILQFLTEQVRVDTTSYVCASSIHCIPLNCGCLPARYFRVCQPMRNHALTHGGTAGYLSFGPMAQCVVHALKGLACRARAVPANLFAAHCEQRLRRLRSTCARLLCQAFLRMSRSQKTLYCFKGSKT